MTNLLLFEDIFDVKDIDKDGKQFEKVSRIAMKGENYEMDLTVDINIDIYPIKHNEKFSIALTSTLSQRGVPDEGFYDQSRKKSLLDRYEYAMHGKIYRYETSGAGGDSRNVAVFASFGGLLMKLEGDPRNLQGLEMDQQIYFLMRKV
eukprot:TRINITY_DN2452_c0_g1_i1.p2 TRINITY_DN2452_c0_g1~~TRINITY_DN2452_c0_g1_i1.p2  ORF type:complete len:148 (+),score=31.65 TRINITY_DN2452_c0_g1_i1:72-515(+)